MSTDGNDGFKVYKSITSVWYSLAPMELTAYREFFPWAEMIMIRWLCVLK